LSRFHLLSKGHICLLKIGSLVSQKSPGTKNPGEEEEKEEEEGREREREEEREPMGGVNGVRRVTGWRKKEYGKG